MAIKAILRPWPKSALTQVGLESLIIKPAFMRHAIMKHGASP